MFVFSTKSCFKTVRRNERIGPTCKDELYGPSQMQRSRLIRVKVTYLTEFSGHLCNQTPGSRASVRNSDSVLLQRITVGLILPRCTISVARETHASGQPCLFGRNLVYNLFMI